MPTRLTSAEVKGLFEKLSNWGKWGKEDERGALNFITNEKRIAAARLVQSGEMVSMSLPLATAPATDNPNPVTHLMIQTGVDASRASLEDFCGLVIQPVRFFCLGASVFRHHLRADGGVGVIERVGLLPGFKCGTKLGKKTPLKKAGELLVALGLRLYPLNYSRCVIQALLIGGCGDSFGLNAQFACLAVEF